MIKFRGGVSMMQNGICGIVGYGSYIPRFRIKIEEIAKVWGKDGSRIAKGLGVVEKSVPDMDEDTITIAVEAAKNALKVAEIDPSEINAIYTGSESHPYTVKPTASTVAEALGAVPCVTCADLEFACKAGTAGIQMCMGLVASDEIKYGMSIGADCAQGKPGDALEYTASAGGAAYIIGKNGCVAKIEGTFSFTTDTPDFWRRDGAEFPCHAARFTGEPAYFKHVIGGAQGLMDKLGTTINDYDYFVFHQPNAKFPLRTAISLQIPTEKLKEGLVVRHIGNSYSGSSLLGLARILDIANPGERILVTSYGSGAGSDAFSLITTDLLPEKRKNAPNVDDYIRLKEYVSYALYAKHRSKIRGI